MLSAVPCQQVFLFHRMERHDKEKHEMEEEIVISVHASPFTGASLPQVINVQHRDDERKENQVLDVKCCGMEGKIVTGEPTNGRKQE